MKTPFRQYGDGSLVTILWGRWEDDSGIVVEVKLGKYTKKEMEKLFWSRPLRDKSVAVVFEHKVLCIYKGYYKTHTPFHAFATLNLTPLIEEMLASAFKQAEQTKRRRR